jgi:hypothetical protein
MAKRGLGGNIDPQKKREIQSKGGKVGGKK